MLGDEDEIESEDEDIFQYLPDEETEYFYTEDW